MLRLILSTILAAALAMGGLAGTSNAMDGAQSGVAGLSTTLDDTRARSPAASPRPVVLVRQSANIELVQFSCRRACKRCRRRCIADWKWYCDGYGCRRGFSQCMKYCWSDICRDC